MKKHVLFRLSDGTVAYLQMNSVGRVLKDKGLNAGGYVQRFHTANVLRRIKRYMPFVSGMTYKVTVVQTDIRRPYIITDTPYAQYLFRGKVMIDPVTGVAGFLTPIGWRYRKGCTKVPTQRNLVYNKSKNPKAGPRWDKTLSASEGKAMAMDIQRYIARKR